MNAAFGSNPPARLSADAAPALYLMVGLPGAGKTSRAKEIALAQAALRLSPDEWILTLFGEDLDRPRRDAVRTPWKRCRGTWRSRS